MIRSPKCLSFSEGHCRNMGNTYTVHFENKLNYDYLAGLCELDKRITTKQENSMFSLTVGQGESVTPTYLGKEAYSLKISEDGIGISAWTEQGISQGLKMLAVLCNKHGRKLPCLTIQDEPSIGFRGLHICIFRPDDGTDKEDTSPGSVKCLIEQAALAGYNHVFLEFWGTFPYRKHTYACWPDSPYTRTVVDELIGHIIDELHITPVPCQNLTSHAGWSRISSRQHVVLDQRPDLEDMWIPGGWCFATENPRTKAYLADVMDDLLETFRHPPLFHVCSDKCFGFASTEEDRTKPADALFITHLCNLNTYLQQKGTRMAMWGDMLYSSMDSLYWKPTAGIADSLPKNILINIWTHNDVGNHWADIDYFQSRGFETIYSPFINKAGTDSMIKLCCEKNSMGILQTSWHRPKTALPNILYSGAAQWNGGAVSEQEMEICETIF